MNFYSFYGNVIRKRSVFKNELALRSFNANQVIYGANSSFDDDVKYDSDSVADSTSINFISFRTYYLFNQFMKNRQKNFATGNAIYLPPRTIIQLANDNSLFGKQHLHMEYISLN
jgi:hypothetical protein